MMKMKPFIVVLVIFVLATACTNKPGRAVFNWVELNIF